MQFGESPFLFRNEVTNRQGVQNNRNFLCSILSLGSIRMKKSLAPNDENAYGSRETSDLPNALHFCVRVRVTGDAHITRVSSRGCPYHCNIATLEARNPGRVSFRKVFWDRYWRRAVHLLANLFPLSLLAVPDIFEKVYSEQFHSRIKRGEWKHHSNLFSHNL